METRSHRWSIRGVMAAAVLMCAAAAMQSVVSGTDWAAIPPAPAETEATLKAAPVSMAQAMSAAEQAAGGVATSARAQVGADNAVVYEFICTAGGVMKRVEVDGKTGAVTAATITLNAAIAKALERQPGVVKMADSNLLADPPTYRIQSIAGGRIHEFSIDATNGAVLEEIVKGRFPGVLAEGDIVTLPSGLKFIEIEPGSGATPSGPTAAVKVHYSGYLVDGTKFDSSVDRGQPIEFALNKVVKGWTEGVGSMRVGGKRKLIIPAAMGYGPEGRGPIPPNATLIFDVELLDTK